MINRFEVNEARNFPDLIDSYYFRYDPQHYPFDQEIFVLFPQFPSTISTILTILLVKPYHNPLARKVTLTQRFICDFPLVNSYRGIPSN